MKKILDFFVKILYPKGRFIHVTYYIAVPGFRVRWLKKQAIIHVSYYITHRGLRRVISKYENNSSIRILEINK